MKPDELEALSARHCTQMQENHTKYVMNQFSIQCELGVKQSGL